MSNYGWTNEEGEPIMDGAAYRFEQQLDMESAEQRYLDDDEFFGPDDDEHSYDFDDLNEDEVPWCYGCDDYARCGDYENHDTSWTNGNPYPAEDAGMEFGLWGSET
jgi:hypothetical protein